MVSRIVVLARPKYPYTEQLNDPWAYCNLRETDWSRAEWGGQTFNDMRRNGNYRHAYFAHDSDTARRHRAWELSATYMSELCHWVSGVKRGEYTLKDMLHFLKCGRSLDCKHPAHGRDGMGCLRTGDPIECRHPYYDEPDCDEWAYDVYYDGLVAQQ